MGSSESGRPSAVLSSRRRGLLEGCIQDKSPDRYCLIRQAFCLSLEKLPHFA